MLANDSFVFNVEYRQLVLALSCAQLRQHVRL